MTSIGLEDDGGSAMRAKHTKDRSISNIRTRTLGAVVSLSIVSVAIMSVSGSALAQPPRQAMAVPSAGLGGLDTSPLVAGFVLGLCLVSAVWLRFQWARTRDEEPARSGLPWH